MNTAPRDSDDKDEIRYYPEGFVYKPAIDRPIGRKERTIVQIVSWTLAVIIHIGAFIAAGYYIDYSKADFQIEMAWSNAPLTGFGMMDEVEDWQAAEDTPEPAPQVEPDEDPFESPEEEDTSAEPSLDPDSIVIPEPEPESDEALPDDNAPEYDLTKDKKRLQAVRNDVSTIPNLHVLAPGNARLIVLIRNDRVIGSRFENSIRRLFKAFPDYRFTLGSSEIDPVRDIQAMLIATANPQLYAETFLVVAHNIPQDNLKKYITDSFPTRLNWQEHNARPLAVPDTTDGKFNPRSGIYKRSVYLPDDHTVLFLRPEVLPTLDTAHVDAIVQARDDDLDTPEQAQTFLQSLGAISNSDSASMPTLFLMVQGIQDVSFGSSFPKFEPPQAIVASMSTSDRPHINLEATFESPKAAKDFVKVWPDILSAAGSLGIPGLAGLLGGLALAPEKSTVLVTGDLNGTMISLILMFAAQHLEKNA